MNTIPILFLNRSESLNAFRAVFCIILIILFGAHAAAPVKGQGQSGVCQWTSLVNLSGSPDFHSKQPVAVGDVTGRVHVFWTEVPEDTYGESDRQFIAYRYHDGTSWSPIGDILLAPENGWADVAKVVADPKGAFLHLAWVDSQGVNVSSVEAVGALNARSWNTIRLALGDRMALPALTIDSQRRLHALYVEDFHSLMYVSSGDHGASWTNPVAVFDLTGEGQAISVPNLLVDSQGGLHAVWAINDQELDWTPSGIRYANSFDSGLSWSVPLEFVQVVGGDPALTQDSDGVIHLLWNGRAGSGGRYYTWSSDFGATWAPMTSLEGYLGGLSGRPKIVIDSLGTIHVLQGSGITSGGGVNSAYLVGTEWSPPVAIPEAPGSDHPDLAITNGNLLYALVWSQVAPAEILYATCQTAAPAMTPAVAPTLPEKLIQAAGTVDPSQGVPATTAIVNDQVALKVDHANFPTDLPPPSSGATHSPALASGLSTLILLTLVLVITRRRNR